MIYIMYCMYMMYCLIYLYLTSTCYTNTCLSSSIFCTVSTKQLLTTFPILVKRSPGSTAEHKVWLLCVEDKRHITIEQRLAKPKLFSLFSSLFCPFVLHCCSTVSSIPCKSQKCKHQLM